MIMTENRTCENCKTTSNVRLVISSGFCATKCPECEHVMINKV
jgi:hypothetical protein